MKNQLQICTSEIQKLISEPLHLKSTEKLISKAEAEKNTPPRVKGELSQTTTDLIYNALSERTAETSQPNNSKLTIAPSRMFVSQKKCASRSLAGFIVFSILAFSSAPAYNANCWIFHHDNLLSQEELASIEKKIIKSDGIESISETLNPYSQTQQKQIMDYLITRGATDAVARFRNLQANGNDYQKNDMAGLFFAADTGKKVYTDLANAAKTTLPVVAGIFVLKSSTDIVENLKNFYISGRNSVKRLLYKLSHKGININTYQTTLNRIEKRLRSELVGQDKAIDRILEILTGYFESMLEAKALGRKFEGGLLLYLTGSPATGKSTTMKIIEEEMGLRSYVGRMSDAVEDRGNGAQTVASRLTKPVIEDNGKVKVSVDTQLTQQIRTRIPTLYCFDEVDKMRNLDSVLQKRGMRNESGKIIGGSVDEMLRNFGDTGQINSQNVSGSVLIATSNETQEQLQELEESLYNRYKGCNVQFDDFTMKDYIEIMNRKSKNILEFYKKKFNVTISWDKSALEHYSEKFEKENSGGRGVDILMNDVRFAIKNLRTRNFKSFRNRRVLICYDPHTDKLFAK